MQDIQKVVDYYDDQQIGLDKNSESALNQHLVSLERNAFFQVRYDDVHCLPMKKYPYMIHYTIDEAENEVTVRTVFSTHLDPGIWKKRK